MDIEKMADQELEKLGLKKKEEPKPLSSWGGGGSGFDDMEDDLPWGNDRYKNGGWKDPNYWSKKSKATSRRTSSSSQGSLFRGTAPAEKLEGICKHNFNTEKFVGEAVINHIGLDKIVTELRTEFMRSLDKSKVLVIDGKPGMDALYLAIEEVITKHCVYLMDDGEYLSVTVEDK